MLSFQTRLRRTVQGQKKRLASKQGFTLVELMIVVVAIGILAAAALYVKTAHAASIEHYTTFGRLPTTIVAPGTAATATNMPFEASPGNTLTIAAGGTTTQITYNLTNAKITGTCTVTVRMNGSARPVCP